MTPILAHLHQHFPADWKQAPSPGTPLHFWYQAANLAAYLEFGEHRLYVRWFDGYDSRGQYGGAGVDLEVTPTRAALDRAIPAAVAKAALSCVWQGLPAPAVPEWAVKALGVATVGRLDELNARIPRLRAELKHSEAERAALTSLLTTVGAR
jgi:hypothetical protein